MNKKIETGSALVLAILMIVFGLNKFLGFIAVAPPADLVAQQFMGAMFTSYLYVVVGLVEIIGGVLLLMPRFRFVGWLLQGVVIFNIVAFHIAHDFIGNGIWLLPTALFLFLGAFQFEKITALFNMGKSAVTIMFLVFTLNLSAQSNYDSYKVENSLTINHDAQSVWNLISDFQNLAKLVPKVVKETKVNGTGVYTSWNIFLHSGQIVKEEMTYFNPTEMEFTYVMTKTAMPLSDYFAIQKVERINENKSKVIFTTYFNALPENQALLSKTFNNFQQTFLNNIKNNIQ